MARPLSEIGVMALNAQKPLETSRETDYEALSYSTSAQGSADNESDGPPSSPFVSNVSNLTNSENISPNKLVREGTSPLKLLKSRTSPTSANKSPRKSSADLLKTPRKMSAPEKRFPVKPSITSPPPPPPVEKRPAPIERTLNIDDVLRDNEGLTKAMEILENGDSENEEFTSQDVTTNLVPGRGGDEANMDDTMVSTFSNFSAVPDMTMFAKIGHSPTRPSILGPTPRRNPLNTPAAAARQRPISVYSLSPTPRAQNAETFRDDTNLLDFTEQFNNFSGRGRHSPSRSGSRSPLKSATTQDVGWPSTPSVNRNNMSNLLDFDIPPAPTPRSMPSITPRELESLKSGFLSEVSSLKASLSGKEAEVNSLKTAVGDAEKRVGECMEQVREERSMKEQLEVEKEAWDKRGREMEAVLRNVKEEILHGERERDELEGRLEETEGRRQVAEVMAQEAESKLAALRAGKTPVTPNPNGQKSGECVCGGNKAVELAVEKVSRELHTLYKDKHETKVAALKKSYERRWEKKIMELEHHVEDLSKENDELRRDTTMTKVEPRSQQEVTEDLEKQAAKDAHAKELEAELEGLSEVVKSVKHDNEELRKLLDEERVEKGKLVAAVDEMIPLVAAFDDMLAEMNAAPPTPSATISPKPRPKSNIENLRSSISRSSGLRAPSSISKPPSTSESRIGRGGFGMPSNGSSDRSRSGSSQGMRPGSGMGYRSGIMSSIEKMGNHKGRGE